MSAQNEFSLEERADFWTFGPVPHKGALYTVDFSKKLLDDGAVKNQEAWAAYSQEALKRNDFLVGSAPLHHTIFETLYTHREETLHKGKIENLRSFTADTFKKYWMNTLSQTSYSPTGTDTITHNLKMPNTYSVQAALVGKNEWIKKLPTPDLVIQALLETTNPQSVNDIYQWISGKDTYLWKLNNKPKKEQQRVVSLGDYIGRFDLCADDDVGDVRPAFGVRVAKKISIGNKD